MARPPALSTTRRRVWAWADSHAGLVTDGRDGADWAARSARELLQHVPPPDYVLVLGDITHAYREQEFASYARLRRSSGIARWYEIVGNHDFHATETGLYQRLVRPQLRYLLIDGNLCFIMLSAERSNASGILSPRTRRWLEENLAAHQDKNILLCSHQLVANTLRRTNPRTSPHLVLHPVNWVSALRRRFRIDVWLAAHEHGPPRDRRQLRRRGRTLFVNVAPLSHVYHRTTCDSFILELRAGSRSLRVLCRDHDRARFVREFGTRTILPYPVRLSTGPVFIPQPDPRTRPAATDST